MPIQVVYIQQPPLENLVILDPNWLGSTVFGPALNPDADNPHRSALGIRSNTGRVPLREINRVWPFIDGQSLFHLLEHFDLCKSDSQVRWLHLFAVEAINGHVCPP